jgi:hypothetical protein
MLKPLEVIADLDRIKRFTDAFQNHQRHPNPHSARIGMWDTRLESGPEVFHVQDGKVYRVGDHIIVYDSAEFHGAVRNGDFPGYVPYKTMPFTTKRLVFSQDEIARNGAGCHEDDEFVILGKLIVVTRRGHVLDLNVYGSAILADEREWAESVEEYYNHDIGEVVDQWRDTEVFEDGTVKRILAANVETNRPQRTGKGM